MSATHKAIALLAPSTPLQVVVIPTPVPTATQVLIRPSLVSMTPLTQHQVDHGFLINPLPFIPGGNFVGTVVARGDAAVRAELAVGAKVFGYSFGPREQKACQEIIAVEASRCAVVPPGVRDLDAVSVPDSFVSAWHALSADLGVPLVAEPDATPARVDTPVLIWGGATSVGWYALQILKRHGYVNVTVTASPRHADALRALGAARVVNYADPRVEELVGAQRLVLDCIGDEVRTLPTIARVAAADATVAVLLPVRLAAGGVSIDIPAGLFPESVAVRGVRAQWYERETGVEELQTRTMPRWLVEGWILPGKIRMLNATGTHGVEEALEEFRAGTVRAEKLVLAISWD